MTEIHDVNKHIVAIEDKDYQAYRQERKLRKHSPVRSPSSSMSESNSSDDSLIKLRKMEMSNLLLKKKMTKVIQDVPTISKGTMTVQIPPQNEDLEKRSERTHSTKRVIALSKMNNNSINDEDSEVDEIDEKYLKPISDRKSVDCNQMSNLKTEHKLTNSFVESFETVNNVLDTPEKPNLSVHIKKHTFTSNKEIREGTKREDKKFDEDNQYDNKDTMIKLPTEKFTDPDDTFEIPKIVLQKSNI